MNTLKTILAALFIATGLVHAASFEERVADRAAIERVYHSHRMGATESFEQALPAAELRRLVAHDDDRESALRSRYGVTITAAQIAAEVARIETTTRSPETLAEIKAALRHDPTRFAEAFAKPLLVERELRARFQNDDAIHVAIRRECESARTHLLAAKNSGVTATGLVVQLKQSHSNAVMQAEWSLAVQPESSPAPQPARQLFADLPEPLRKVLSVQLRTAGDVSAVIETPENFLLFVATERTEAKLSAAYLSLPKPDCDTWLMTQHFK
jgi:hypothetical protein